MIFVDTFRIKNNQHHNVPLKMHLPIYMNHIGCGLRWKDAIYIAGGEIEGRWSKKAWRFNFANF